MPVGITVSPYMVKSAQPGVFYFMEHANGRFYILTNHKNQKQYKVHCHINTCYITAGF